MYIWWDFCWIWTRLFHQIRETINVVKVLLATTLISIWMLSEPPGSVCCVCDDRQHLAVLSAASRLNERSSPRTPSGCKYLKHHAPWCLCCYRFLPWGGAIITEFPPQHHTSGKSSFPPSLLLWQVDETHYDQKQPNHSFTAARMRQKCTKTGEKVNTMMNTVSWFKHKINWNIFLYKAWWLQCKLRLLVKKKIQLFLNLTFRLIKNFLVVWSRSQLKNSTLILCLETSVMSQWQIYRLHHSSISEIK